MIRAFTLGNNHVGLHFDENHCINPQWGINLTMTLRKHNAHIDTRYNLTLVESKCGRKNCGVHILAHNVDTFGRLGHSHISMPIHEQTTTTNSTHHIFYHTKTVIIFSPCLNTFLVPCCYVVFLIFAPRFRVLVSKEVRDLHVILGSNFHE